MFYTFRKVIYSLVFLCIYSFLLLSCSVEEPSPAVTTNNKKIEFFSNFEDFNKSLKQESSNYAQPFVACIEAYSNKNPSIKAFIGNKYGIIDLKVSSQTISGAADDGRKLIFFPILKNGNVNAVIAGLVNSNRDFLYFKIYQNENSDVQYLIQTFQAFYTKQKKAKGGDTHELNEVVIIVKRPTQLTQYDGWSGNGGLGSVGALMSGDGFDFSNSDGGGSSNVPNTTNTEPCEKVQNDNDKAKSITSNREFVEKKQKAIAGYTNNIPEKGFVFGIDAYGNTKTGEIKTGTISDVLLPATDPNFTVTGSVHTHPDLVDGIESFSPRDFYALYSNTQANPNFEMLLVLGATGAEYTMTIADPVKFQNFFSNNHSTTTVGVDNGWINTKPIGIAFYDSIRQFIDKGKTIDEAYVLANVAILSKFNMGIAISKKDPITGNFKTLFVKESKDPLDPQKSIYEQISNCNL